jgi:hypothetical protein
VTLGERQANKPTPRGARGLVSSRVFKARHTLNTQQTKKGCVRSRAVGA